MNLILPFVLLVSLAGCVMETRTPTIGTPLGSAAMQGQADVVESLLAHGADPDGENDLGGDAIGMARPFPEIAKKLVKKCAEIYHPGRNCKKALQWAAYYGDTQAVDDMVAKRADLNHALADAAAESLSPAVKVLLAKGADADAAIAELRKTALLNTSGVEGSGNVVAVTTAKAGIWFLLRFKEKKKLALRRSEPGSSAPSVDESTTGGITKEELERIVDEAYQRGAQSRKNQSGAAAYASDVDKPAYAAASAPESYALVVGIEKYAGLPDAQFAERDARSVRDHLAALGYPERNIVLLTGQQASRAGLVKNIETWLARNVSEKSTVFFFYSGHGAPDPESGQAYLVPSDGDPQYLEDTAYPVKRLYEKLEMLKAKRVIVALDACFSGAGGRSVLAKGIKPLVTKVEMGLGGSDKIISLSASASDQISGTIEEQGHGLFTYYFLRGLNGAAANNRGSVTVRNIFDYLSPYVQDRAHRDNREQTPQFLSGSADAAGWRLR